MGYSYPKFYHEVIAERERKERETCDWEEAQRRRNREEIERIRYCESIRRTQEQYDRWCENN